FPADYELSDVARQSGFNTSAKVKISSNQAPKKADLEIEETVETKDLEAPAAIADRSLVKPTARVAPKQPSQKLSQKTSQKTSQIEAVTAYFEDKWQPPGDLSQSLEYRLLLDRHGSIKRVIPLGKAAQLYLSQTNIPVNGEPFIAPLTPSQSSTIRLLLNPNGGVQVFTESN
ncbi:MAG: hypothetical protein HC930_18415, partial [Hydrococcus sp. SU_1_0]|nr:hypothetical protein [Hydrococcus sp. SU_1_0]